MTRVSCCKIVSAATIVVLIACESEAPTAVRVEPLLTETSAAERGRYLVLLTAEDVPSDFVERIAAVGGSVESSLHSIGVVAVAGLTAAAAAELSTENGVSSVERDPVIRSQHIPHGEGFAEEFAPEVLASTDATALLNTSPTTAAFYARQWNMRAVFADEAWAAGHLGSRDVVVAILDTGIDYLHPDLVGLVDLERSTSFVPEDVIPARYAHLYRLPFADLFWHGTAAASIVASNATVVAGVNRHVTLLAVKIADSTFRTSTARLISGIVYAADQGADVITISHGVEHDKGENPGIVAAFQRAANYAFRKGALVVSVPFNDAADLDHNGDRVRYPCEAAHVICVSATGPTRGATVNGPWENVDALASYSAFGRSAIGVAAPGGDGLPNQFRRVWLPCTGTRTQAMEVIPACRFPLTNPVAQSTGTSWAAPHVAGLAALLVAQLGKGQPAQIRAKILQSADDLGKPGTDPSYGKGRINIARALDLRD